MSILHDFSHKIYFYCRKKFKKYVFSPKLAWPPVAYDVITRYHSNWPSLNLSQNVCEGWMNSYWKRQNLTFYDLGENAEKPPCTFEGYLSKTWMVHHLSNDRTPKISALCYIWQGLDPTLNRELFLTLKKAQSKTSYLSMQWEGA